MTPPSRPSVRPSLLRSAGTRALAAASAAGLVTVLAGCGGGGDDPAPTTTPEAPGPTLARGPVPNGWKDVASGTGLLYSVPPEWDLGSTTGPDGTPSGGDDSAGWGSGYVTHANSIAERGYCHAAATSFRVLAGITDPMPGEARDLATSAGRSLSDAISTEFSRNGADVPPPEPEKIGVSGAPAWHVVLRGRTHPPLDECTPPTIRVDAIAVATTASDGSPAAQLFVLMADEDQPGVQPRETVDRVVGSLRYENTV